MAQLIYYLFFFLISSINCKQIKIIGGENAVKGEIPYQVSIRYSALMAHFCGGVILSPKFILTAGHCANKKNVNFISIVAGEISLELTNSSQKQNVVRIFMHPQYNDKTLENDIAIMELEKDLNLDENYAKEIEINNAEIKPYTQCIVSGWGVTNTNSHRVTKILKVADVYLFDKEECAQRYKNQHIKISDQMICAINEEKPADSCQGDSGGPLVCGNYLAGIVSFGLDCASYYPGVYTNVKSYKNWINEIMKPSEPYLCDKNKIKWWNPLWLYCSIFNLWH